MSPFDIIARLERNPTGWVCIRREAADEIRKLRAENAALNKATLRLMGEVSRLTDKLNIIIDELEHYAALDGLLAPLAAAALAKIKETK